MFKKNFSRALAALIVGGNIFISAANAEVQSYIGEGEYIMSDFETPEVAKQRAKNRAVQSAQEQAGVYVESFSHMKNFNLLEDEVFTISSGIMKIFDVQYNQNFLSGDKGIIIRVTLRAEIDSDEMEKWLNKSIEERRKINSQLENLREENFRQEQIIADLKSQLDAGKISKEQVAQDFQEQDKFFTYNQKLQEGWQLYGNGEFQKAVETFTDAIKIFPRNAEGYFGRGTAYNELHENQKALADYNRSIEIAPNPETYNNRGKTNFELQNFSAALADFNKAIQVDKNDTTAYINRGKIYFALRQFENGLADFNRAVELEPQNFLPYVQRAAAFYALGDLDSALEDLNAAINLNPQNFEAYSYRGEVFSNLRNFSAALQDFNKAIELNPNEGETFYLRGKVYQALGDTKNSRADFATAEKLGYTE